MNIGELVTCRCVLWLSYSDVPYLILISLPISTFMWFEIDVKGTGLFLFLKLFDYIGVFTPHGTSGDLRLDDLGRKILRR